MSLLKVVPTSNAEMLSSVPEHKAMRSPGEKIQVLDKLHSGINDSAVGH